jgi:phage-related minor tail protein
MSFFTPSAGQGTSSFLSWLGLGKRMAGGPVNAGSPYLVGEHGPELMVPGQSGMVVPNSAIGRGASGQTFAPVYQINAAGADSGTVERIRTVLAAHSKAIASQANAMVSAQRYQSSGVA